jgi:NAD(P)-dependent dehydrogenase (short-subunit alcohol dehydrogenase family)
MEEPLDKKVAVITGGAGGIGEVFGRGLAQAGASVVLADLDAGHDQHRRAGLRRKAGDPEGFVTEQVRRLEDGS